MLRFVIRTKEGGFDNPFLFVSSVKKGFQQKRTFTDAKMEYECLNTSFHEIGAEEEVELSTTSDNVSSKNNNTSNGNISSDNISSRNADGLFECIECNYSSKYKSNLNRHIKTHSFALKNDASLFCHYCGHVYKTKYGLKKRVDSVHLNNPKFTCQMPDCGKSFMERSKYKAHISMHSDMHCFKCKKCGKKYRYNYNLKQHERKCKQPATITCEMCAATLSDERCLKEHKRGKHSDQGFRCVCGKYFKWRSSLSSHKKSV